LNFANLTLFFFFYFFFGFIFYVSFEKFSKKEILIWTDEKTAKKCCAFDIKWVSLNLTFVLFFGYLHSEGFHFLSNKILILREFFMGLIICSWVSLLVILAKIDLQTNLLPDRLTLSLAIIGIFFSMFSQQMNLMHNLFSAFLGFAFIMTSIFFLLYSRNMYQKIKPKDPGPLLEEVISV
tara:strand:+ start:36 stop:575 length:540 start_codon:yes stop_codon:yes gene_type:complete